MKNLFLRVKRNFDSNSCGVFRSKGTGGRKGGICTHIFGLVQADGCGMYGT